MCGKHIERFTTCFWDRVVKNGQVVETSEYRLEVDQRGFPKYDAAHLLEAAFCVE
jgi:hypothetical protein